VGSRLRVYVDEEREEGGCLAIRPLKPAESPSVHSDWLSQQDPLPSWHASQRAVTVSISYALTSFNNKYIGPTHPQKGHGHATISSNRRLENNEKSGIH